MHKIESYENCDTFVQIVFKDSDGMIADIGLNWKEINRLQFVLASCIQDHERSHRNSK